MISNHLLNVQSDCAKNTKLSYRWVSARKTIANALELCLFCTNPLIWCRAPWSTLVVQIMVPCLFSAKPLLEPIGPLRNKLWYDLDLNTTVFYQENAFQNVACKMVAIFFSVASVCQYHSHISKLRIGACTRRLLGWHLPLAPPWPWGSRGVNWWGEMSTPLQESTS